jgi:hypothetical protein
MSKKDLDLKMRELLSDIISSSELPTSIDGYLYLEEMVQQYISYVSGYFDKMGPKEEIPEFKKFLEAVAERRAKEWYY